MESHEIISLTVAEARRRFAPNPHKGLTKLIREWHPDTCKEPDAVAVTQHLTRLRASFSGTAAALPPLREFTRADGGRFGLRPLSAYHDGSAEVLVCAHSVSRLFSADNADLADAALRAVSGFRFADSAMERDMRVSLPDAPKTVALAGGGVLHTFPRRPDQVPLVDLIRSKGPFRADIGAWVVSRLLHLLCWMDWAGIAHGGIAPETVLVSPARHEACLFGGWEFSAPLGNRPIALPDRTLRLFPSLTAPGTGLTAAVDAALVRETFFAVVGAPHASALLGGAVPAPLARWATFPAGGGARADAAAWKAALREAFGAPKFLDMGVDALTLYDGDAR